MKLPHDRIAIVASVILALGCAGAEATRVSATEPKCPTVTSVPPSPETKVGAAPVEAVASELVKRINAGDGEGVVALFGADMAKEFPEEKMGPFVAGIVNHHGHILDVGRVRGEEGLRDGTFKLKTERHELRMQLHVDASSKITGMLIVPAPQEPPVSKSSVLIGLPFRGQWFVNWGGDTPEMNAHVGQMSQRRAADLVVVDADRKTHRGDGKRNEDYYAYGRDVLAVADGVVITVISGVPENVPGELNPSVLGGNSVVVKHADTLYSFYAHLQPGGVRVHVGEKVKRGAVVGVCGNSGNSGEPHLHFQLQDGPLFEKSWGVEPVFADVSVVRDGKASKMAEYSWLKGDLVGEPQTR